MFNPTISPRLLEVASPIMSDSDPLIVLSVNPAKIGHQTWSPAHCGQVGFHLDTVRVRLLPIRRISQMVAGVASWTTRCATTALVLGAAVTLGLAPAAALGSSKPNTAATTDAATSLADRYSPVMRLVDRTGSCGNDDALRPTNVNAVLDNREVALRGPWDSTKS